MTQGYEENPWSTQPSSSQLSQSYIRNSFTNDQSLPHNEIESYMPIVNPESPWSTQLNSTRCNQQDFQGDIYSNHMFPDLNAPASTEYTDVRESSRLEAVCRLVQPEEENLETQCISADDGREMSEDSAEEDGAMMSEDSEEEDGREMSEDSEEEHVGVDAADNNMDDEALAGEPSTSTLAMYAPIAPFFTHIDDSLQPYADTTSDDVCNILFDPKRDELSKGLRFKDKYAVQDAVRKYNIFREREFRVGNTNTTCWEAVCKYRKSHSCLWRLRASIQKRHGMFEIVKYTGPHSCEFPTFTQDHPHLSASLMCNEVSELVKKEPSFKISSIVGVLKLKYNFTSSYQKAWNAKQKAIALIFGDWDTSYRLLPKFLGAIKKYNEGTVVHYDTSRDLKNPDKTIFRRVFWAFAPCIEGFKSCRPLVSIDATHLYGKYKGKILIAIGKDGNSHLFPLAFAIVDEESRNNWAWFLRILRRDVVGERPDVCLISDRHRGILAAVADVSNGWDSSKAHHRFCLRHVQSNFNTKFKNAALKKLMYDAGSVLQIRHFNAYMEQIKIINQKAWEYLMEIPLQKWTLSHDGGYRFGNKTTNISESFNGVLKNGRCLPITACVQVIFFKCVSYFESRRFAGITAKSEGKFFTPDAMLKLTKSTTFSGNMTVHSFNRATGEAGVLTVTGDQHAVSVNQRTCTCGKWQSDKVPCSHAVAVMHALAINSWEYVSEYYTIDTFIRNWGPEFHPLHPEEYWDEPRGRIWIPDKQLRREKGRPRSTRITNEMDIIEKRTTNCCGICRQPGHDRRTCPDNSARNAE